MKRKYVFIGLAALLFISCGDIKVKYEGFSSSFSTQLMENDMKDI